MVHGEREEEVGEKEEGEEAGQMAVEEEEGEVHGDKEWRYFDEREWY